MPPNLAGPPNPPMDDLANPKPCEPTPLFVGDANEEKDDCVAGAPKGLDCDVFSDALFADSNGDEAD